MRRDARTARCSRDRKRHHRRAFSSAPFIAGEHIYASRKLDTRSRQQRADDGSRSFHVALRKLADFRLEDPRLCSRHGLRRPARDVRRQHGRFDDQQFSLRQWHLRLDSARWCRTVLPGAEFPRRRLPRCRRANLAIRSGVERRGIVALSVLISVGLAPKLRRSARRTRKVSRG